MWLLWLAVAHAQRSCPQSGLYFDDTSLECRSCATIDPGAELVRQEERHKRL